MFRPVMSYALTVIIFLAQAGLPLHMHYCKGMLESISVFINPGCNDHEEIADLPACCQKALGTSCANNDKSCCDDEVKVLLQEFDSLLPHFDKWDAAPTLATGTKLSVFFDEQISCPVVIEGQNSDSGPPIYILFHSLIYYA